MICPNCGKEYNDKMTCCISCGAELVPYESDGGQTAFEPLIPDIPAPEPKSVSEPAGFVREIHGHTSAPAVPEPAPESEIPVYTETGVTLSDAVKFVCSLFASAAMLTFIMLFSAAAAVRIATDSSRIAEFAEDLDVMSLPAEGYFPDEDATVQDAIYVMSAGTGLSREDIRTIYEASTVQDFLTSQLNGYAGYIRGGRAPEKITADKLKSVFSENLGVIDETMGAPLSQHDINLAFSHIDRAQPALEQISPSSLEARLGNGGLTALRLMSSMPAVPVSAALAAAMLPLLRTINKSGAGMLRWGGGAAVTGGAAVLASMFLLTIQPFAVSSKLMRSIVSCAANVIAPDLYRIGGALAVLGIVMLVWAGTLGKVKNGSAGKS